MLKKYRTNIIKEYRKLILRFLVYAVLIQAYSLFNLIGMVSLRQSLSFLFPQLFQYGYYPTIYTYTYNLQRMMLMQPEYMVRNQTATMAAKDILLKFYNIDLEINNLALEILSDPNLNQDYLATHFGNPCLYISSSFENSSLISECNDTLNEQFSLGITNFKQHAFNIYDQTHLNFSMNPQNFSPLLDSPDFKQLNKVLKLYFKEVCYQLISFIEINIQQQLDNASQIQSISFTIFLATLLLFFFFYWYPTVNKMNSDINRTISMLNIIPTKVIRECASIRRVVKKLIKNIEKS